MGFLEPSTSSLVDLVGEAVKLTVNVGKHHYEMTNYIFIANIQEKQDT